MQESETDKVKKFWFWLSISINLGFLSVFKYYNFFANSLQESLSSIGFEMNPILLHVVLPVGISFYTFHGLSYVIDIYNGRIKAEKNFVDYSLFVSYFPLLVAGPIERATHLLPQIKKKRHFNYAKAILGLRQILWGMFKKIVIADNCAVFVNAIFDKPELHSGSTLLFGAILFALQIYGDFSGYSDIALGVSKLFGIDLLRNFNYPYFSRDIAEFWRRWHISLSSWFRDYLYIPLGGSKGNVWVKIRNTIIIFLVSGFWHGANWTFIVWGLLNAVYIMPSILMNTNRNNLSIVAETRFFPTLKESFQMITTFALTVLAWVFFRAESVVAGLNYLKGIFNSSLFSVPANLPKIEIILSLFMLGIEWMGRRNNFAIENLDFMKDRKIRWCFYTLLLFLILGFGAKEQSFIYFQF
jgi:D-alanyl-lipoteichoic acid acyltransferase DltB (MBOAT superfamily)